MPAPGTIRLVDPDGAIRDVDPAAAASALQDPRWRIASTEDELGRVAEQAREEAYGGAGGAVKAGAAAVARGATLGLSDVAARALGGEDTAIELEGLREVNPSVSFGGELVGALAPAILSGGSSAGASAGEIGAGLAARGLVSRLPAGAVSRLGAGIARAGAEGGALGKLGGAVAGGAVEGALFGAGQGLTELSLSRDPLTAERAVSAIGSNALFGAAAGGALGGAGNLVERGLVKAKGVIDDALARRAAKAAATTDEAIAMGDLTILDRPKLDSARAQELEAIKAERAPARERIVEDLKDYRDSAYKEDLFDQHFGIDDGFVREAGGSLKTADRRIRNRLDVEVALAKDPSKALYDLQQQEQAMRRLRSHGVRKVEEVSQQIDALPQAVRADIRAGNVADERGPFVSPSEGLDNAVARETERRIVKLRDQRQKYHTIVDTMSPAIGKNQELQNAIANVSRPLASERLTKIDDAIDALSRPAAPQSFGGALLSAAVPFAGPLGAAAAAGGRLVGGARKLLDAAGQKVGKAASVGLEHAAAGAAVAPRVAIPAVAHLIGERDAGTVHGLISGRIERANTESAERTRSAVDAFAGSATAKKYEPVIATKVLAGVRYAAPAATARGAHDTAGRAADSLAALFKARSGEIKGLTAYDETGTPRIRPEARQAIADALRPVAAVDPLAADRMETIAVRRIEYLSSIIPRQPDFGISTLGNSLWQPSDMEMRSWARSVAAVEDPGGVEERAVHGALTPEDAQAYWAVYPERAAHFKQSILTHPELTESMTYPKRLMLSIFTGEPLDPSLHPEVLAALQGQFRAEPNTSGGAHAPRSTPQLGSLSNISENTMTPAQERQS